jgi:hypothetical protein
MWQMAYKPRSEPKELKILKALNNRMMLLEKDKQHLFTLKKGYEGEVMFDTLTEKLKCECYILNDLLFKVNNTTFQIDTLIIISEKVCYYEVKNFAGDYFYESDKNRLYKKPLIEYNNPLLQLSRGDSLLRQLFQSIGYNTPIDAQVIFINPEFTLYQAPLNNPFIFPTQVNNHLKKLDAVPSKLNGKHKSLADKLISLHIEENPYATLPKYTYGQLKKGVTCVICDSNSVTVSGKKCVCGDCGHEEPVTVAVMRNVEEIKFLFPNIKITTNLIHEWCVIVELKRTIQRILEKNFKKVGVRQWTYYE